MKESNTNILKNNAQPFAVAIGVAVGVVALLFALQSVGLYVMSKKRGLDKKWLCFVPFAATYQIGRLAGPCEIFGRKMKRAGLYAMIAQIASVLLCALFVVAQCYLYVKCGSTMTIDQTTGRILSDGLSTTGRFFNACYEVTSSLVSIFSLLESVLTFILVMGLFKKYSVKNYMVLSWVTLFVPMARFVIIFILRNNAPIDFEAYMRAKREAYVRRMQSNANPYGQSPYGQHMFGHPPYGDPSQNSAPQEPFSEFGSSSREPFSEFGGGNQDPFSEFSSAPQEPFAEFGNANYENDSSKKNGDDSDDLFE